MAFAADFLDELRARLGLTEIVGRRVRLRRSGREASGLCPFHNEKTPSFTVSEEKGFFHCFGCGAHGDVIGFTMRVEGLSFPEAVEKLAAEAGLDVPQPSRAEREAERRRADFHGALEACCRFFERELAGPRGGAARAYLERRGIDPETAARFRLGYAPDSRTALRGAVMSGSLTEALLVETGMLIRPDDGTPYDRFRGRVTFPIADRRGRVIAFGGRLLGDGRPKYLNSPDTPLFDKGRVLYGMAAARRAAHETGRVVVVEGYTDVIALARSGIAEAVAPLGTALTESHLAELWRMADEPILCFDGDEAGRRAAHRAAERALPLLRPGKSLQFVRLDAGEDPDGLVASGGRAAVDACLARRRDLIETVWEIAAAGRRFDTPERAAGFERELERLVGRIDDGKVRYHYLDALRRRARETLSPGRRRRAPLRPGGDPEILQSHGPRCVASTLLGHPSLAEEFYEEIGGLDVADERLDKLLGEILILAGGTPGLDARALKGQLTDMSAETAERLLGGSARRLWPFARPDSPVEGARRGLVQVLDRLSKPAGAAELAEARSAYADDPSEENWSRFRDLAAVRAEAAEAAERAGAGMADAPAGHRS